ncbi:GPI anchored protein, putative [Paecilomyces variotii No. 5]|uniref:GPI anchored protein, putative n=1 Tax=Byssochlamys spectabilis (strain No. 5 / NBRC 109023) TaxID=1356009 RepID=V5FH37_BYSSN|nr:GPI anchored protein, putative [Paecilomyces variotii No. 5]
MKLYMTLLLLPMAVLANDSQEYHRQKASANGLRKAVQNSLETRQSSGSDYCNGPGVTCVSCFGSGYIQCPGDSFTCYKPGDPVYGSCSGGYGGGSGSSSGSGGSSSGSDDTTTTSEYVPSSTSSSYSPTSSSYDSDWCYGKSGTGSSGSSPSSAVFPTAVASSTSSWSFTDTYSDTYTDTYTSASTPFTTTYGGSEPTSSSLTFSGNSGGATATGSSSVVESNDGAVMVPMLYWNIGVGAIAMVAIVL